MKKIQKRFFSPLFYAIFQCGTHNIFKKRLDLFYAEVPAGPAELAKSSNPDHVGGFQVQINLDLRNCYRGRNLDLRKFVPTIFLHKVV